MSENKKKRGRKPKNYYLNLENKNTDVNVNNTDVNANTTDVNANTTDVNVNNTDVNANVNVNNTDVNANDTNVNGNVNVNDTDVNVVVKKKRGRKPKDYVPTEEELKKKEEAKEPKKRGRKPKEKTLEDETVVKTFKKRGRKPKDKIIDFIPKEVKEKKNIQNENIILQIPYTMKSILTDNNIDNIYNEQNTENNAFQYNPKLNEPEPFDPYINSYNNDYCNYEVLKNNNKNIDINSINQETNRKTNEDISTMNSIMNNAVNKVMNNAINDYNNLSSTNNSLTNNKSENEENNLYNDDKRKLTQIFKEFCSHKNNETSYPEKTDISCWWCCHNFNTIPVSLPYKYYNKKFHTYGIFCSFNCACSYNFQTDDYNMYERYGLLNLLYKKISKSDKLIKIKMSSPRETLKKFGGYLSIEEFRKNNLSNQKVYKVNLPPIITILPSIEEKSDNFKNTIKEINDYKLKRSKPLIIKNNTLESFIKGSE